jgi:hypothetical protein
VAGARGSDDIEYYSGSAMERLFRMARSVGARFSLDCMMMSWFNVWDRCVVKARDDLGCLQFKVRSQVDRFLKSRPRRTYGHFRGYDIIRHILEDTIVFDEL